MQNESIKCEFYDQFPRLIKTKSAFFSSSARQTRPAGNIRDYHSKVKRTKSTIKTKSDYSPKKIHEKKKRKENDVGVENRYFSSSSTNFLVLFLFLFHASSFGYLWETLQTQLWIEFLVALSMISSWDNFVGTKFDSISAIRRFLC